MLNTDINIQQPSYTKYLVCLAAAFFSFYDIFQLSLFNVINHLLTLHFHLTASSLGLLSSCFLWGNALGIIPVGIMLDRGYCRQTALTLIGFSIVMTIVFAFTHSAILVGVVRFIQGLASAASLLVCMRLAILWFKEQANLAIGWMITIALSGGMFANTVFSYLMHYFSLQDGLLMAAGIGFLIFILMLFLLQEPSQNRVEHLLDFSIKKFLKFLIQKPSNACFGIYLGLINFPVFILGSLWGNYYLMHVHHLTLTQAGMISTLIFAGIIIGSPLWGILANKLLSPKAILFIGCFGLIILSLLFFKSTISVFEIQIIFLLFGVFCSSQNLIYYVIGKLNSTNQLSTATAIASFIFNCVGALSQIGYSSLIGLSSANFALLILAPVVALLVLGGGLRGHP